MLREFVAVDVVFSPIEFRFWRRFCGFAGCVVVCDVLVGGASSVVVAETVVVLG